MRRQTLSFYYTTQSWGLDSLIGYLQTFGLQMILSKNHAVIDNGISTRVLPGNWLLGNSCSYSNWSTPKCIYCTAMVRPFLQNTRLSSKRLLGMNNYLCNTKCLTKFLGGYFSFSSIWVLFLDSYMLLSLLDTDARRPKEAHSPNLIHYYHNTIYSPWRNSIYKAPALSNIQKHWADTTSFLSLHHSLGLSLSPSLSSH